MAGSVRGSSLRSITLVGIGDGGLGFGRTGSRMISSSVSLLSSLIFFGLGKRRTVDLSGGGVGGGTKCSEILRENFPEKILTSKSYSLQSQALSRDRQVSQEV